MSTGIATRFRESTQSAISGLRPWSEFFDLSAFSLPPTLSDASTRLFQNAAHFRPNYAAVLLTVFFLSLVSRPLSLLVFLAVLAAWFFLYFSSSREDDDVIVVLGFLIADRVVLAVLGVVTVVALFVTRVWLNIVVSGVVGVALVCLHAVFRGTEDLVMDDQDSPYGGLLRNDESDPGGNYTIM